MGNQMVDESKFFFIDVFKQINDENMIETECKFWELLRHQRMHH